MHLKSGDSGEAVKALQSGLNKFGAILLLDGDYGPLTREAVRETSIALGRPASEEAPDELQQAIAAHPDPFPALTAAGVTFIARAEVSGPREYRRRYKNPVWPSAQSGITIGIGYDLRFVNRRDFESDWRGRIPEEAIERLARVLSRTGSNAALAGVRTVEIPLPVAMSVFLERTLPAFVADTRAAYPQFDILTPERRTALVSLVYNRGPLLRDRDPLRQERREMRAIRDLIAAGDLTAVPAQFESMQRLWTLPGLIQRRYDEARLWRSGIEALQLA
jgi:peptidoglycan hydrolase-like protein with peptidoglycan-binding domain